MIAHTKSFSTGVTLIVWALLTSTYSSDWEQRLPTISDLDLRPSFQNCKRIIRLYRWELGLLLCGPFVRDRPLKTRLCRRVPALGGTTCGERLVGGWIAELAWG